MSERSDFFGGGQRSLRDLALGLRGGTVEPCVVLPGPGALATALEAGGIAWEAVPLPPLRRAVGIEACRALARLVRLVRRRDLDLLHSDSPRSALYAGLAAILTGRRHVWHLRASRPSSRLADRALLALCDAAVAVSRAVARRSPACRASRKIRVVPTGIAPIRFLDRDQARARFGLPLDRLVAGVIGRIEPDKGGDDAIASLAALRSAAPGALLAFVGPEDPGHPWAHTCRLRAAAAGLSEAVLFLKEQPEAAALLRGFDLILHPSRHEALPRVLIEALFAGVPVVAYSVGGVAEVIESGVTGLLVRAGDPVALGSAAAALARDEDMRRRLSGAGPRRAWSLFSLDTMIRGILAVYEELVPSKRKPALEPEQAAR